MIEKLERENINFEGIEAVVQNWSQKNSSYSYLQFPRPNAGLFFVRADIRATFRLPSGKEWRVGKGNVVFLPRGIHYDVRLEGDFSKEARPHSYVVNFLPMLPDGREVDLGAEPIVLIEHEFPVESLEISALAKACHEIPCHPLRVKALFFQILESVFSAEEEHRQAEFYPIRKGVELLRREWSENLKISRYAEICGMSESYFHTLFRQWAGMTPVEYRNRQRISYACSYLKNTAYQVGEVARLVGFDDPFYFSRLFKQITGTSPREYRKE